MGKFFKKQNIPHPPTITYIRDTTTQPRARNIFIIDEKHVNDHKAPLKDETEGLNTILTYIQHTDAVKRMKIIED